MKISFIKHNQLDEYFLSKIIELKNQHWKYSVSQHKEWINNNIVDEDYHLILSDDQNNILAYLNLINIIIINDDKEEIFGLGIGNVCVDYNAEKKGLGLLLMQIVNFYIKNNNKQAFLICKNTLINFYNKSGWKVFEGDFFVRKKEVQGVLMHLFPVSSHSLLVNKNF